MFDHYRKIIEKKLGLDRNIVLAKPPSTEYGDFCIIVNQYSKTPEIDGKNWKIMLADIEGIDEVALMKVETKKKGIYYINFKLNIEMKIKLRGKYIKGIARMVYNKNFGYTNKNKGKVAIVEHTSANPISPLHVGNLRNSVQGDTFARILEATGYKVYRHFYVNDVGLQISFVVIGYEIAKNNGLKPAIKVDHWMGQIYAIMNCFYTTQQIKNSVKDIIDIDINEPYRLKNNDVKNIKKKIEEDIEKLKTEYKYLFDKEQLDKNEKKQLLKIKRQITKLQEQIDQAVKYMEIFEDLKLRFPDLFEILYSEVQKINLKEKQEHYLKSYEHNSDSEITKIFREVVDWVLQAFSWTLKRYNIEFDQFDFESDITWSGLPDKIIDELSQSKYAKYTGDKGVRFTYPSDAVKKLAKVMGISKKNLPIKGEIPDLQLRRSNGTALYAAKDIAYSLKKFMDKKPDVVFNVISTEQILPQFQLLLPLLELGYPEYASNLIHYDYELVDLKGRPMSGRLASYVTADAFFDETYIRARMAKREADSRRGESLPKNIDEWRQEEEILRAISLASTRFPLIEKSPKRRIVLNLDEELDFKKNSGPFIEYAHARANKLILTAKNQLGIEPNSDIDYTFITDDLSLQIATHLNEFEDTINRSSETKDPSLIAIWGFQLAQLLMKYYESYSVIKAENIDISRARLLVIDMIRVGLKRGLEILGIPAVNKI